jgi:hypothetical protein
VNSRFGESILFDCPVIILRLTLLVAGKHSPKAEAAPRFLLAMTVPLEQQR